MKDALMHADHHVSVKQCRESRATAGVRDRPGSQEFEDVRTQDTDIGGIVRSEMMKFLQVRVRTCTHTLQG